jgi:antitoxin YefM
VKADDFVSVTEAKDRLLSLIRTVHERDTVLAITKGGTPAAVMLSPERYEGLLETIEVLSDPRTMKSLRRSIKQAERQQWVDDRAVFGKDHT